jgi:hypothetical protein
MFRERREVSAGLATKTGEWRVSKKSRRRWTGREEIQEDKEHVGGLVAGDVVRYGSCLI